MISPFEAARAADRVLRLPETVRAVDFISDLHLTEELPETFAAWERYMADTTADALFILGDLFEAWVGDDMRALPFEQRCVAIVAAAAAKRPVWVGHGNRDFMLGEAFAAATGVRLLDDPAAVTAFGRTAVLSHGDALCIDDLPYQSLRRMVRNDAWQKQMLAHPLEVRLALASKARVASKAARDEPVTFADADPAMAKAWLDEHGADTLIHGHTHRPRTHAHEGWTRHVLSDWDLDTPVPEARRAEVLRWTAAGFERLAPAQAGPTTAG
jgi:UDP-2,3-diacylglucosamine hydrolase